MAIRVPANLKLPVEIHRHSPAAPWTYARLDELQKKTAARSREGQPGAILLSEVAPVITVGRRTAATDLLMPEALLKSSGVEVLPVDRGGFATYHGPGQWVLFVVDRLEALTGDRRGVRKAVDALLNIGLQVGKSYGLEARLGCGSELGVWGPEGKFAALGIHIDRGVLTHGLAINGYQTRESFIGLRPCGLDAPVSFLLKQGARENEFEEMGQRILEACAAAFR